MQATMNAMADRLAHARMERMECRIMLKWWASSAIRGSRAAMAGVLALRRERGQTVAIFNVWRSAVRSRRLGERCAASVATRELPTFFRRWCLETTRSLNENSKLRLGNRPSVRQCEYGDDDEDAASQPSGVPDHKQVAAHAAAHMHEDGAGNAMWSRSTEYVAGFSSGVRGMDPQGFCVHQHILTDACEYWCLCMQVCVTIFPRICRM